MKKLFLVLIAALVSQVSFAQLPKIGYVYDDYVMVNLKDIKDLQNEVAAKREEFSKQFEAKAKVYQEKYALYQQSLKDISNVTTESLNAALKEVQDLKKVADEYQSSAEAELQNLIQTKYKEIRDKVDATTKKVAAEKGYKFVFRRNVDGSNRESTPILLFANDNDRDNLSDAILLKLGSTPPPKPKPAVSAPKPAATTKKPAPKKS
ncbi:MULTISPECIES: OmpH family outer membrane protein [Emticicia]|uniref:OmpH family outer membrane protein n=1 Tax=Emticicia TaxID=312278 RepID=UPI0020A1282F|nr:MULTISPECIES: OmpH family outer membrane protein [Emticicia]UTA68246.1 OmpH family outer membrane protein [Emticicia sp. 21SJ11W-3]